MSAETLNSQGAAVSLGPIGQLQLYSVSVLAGGNFYVASDVSPSNGYAYQLFGQEFTSSGAPIGSALDLSNGYYGSDAYGRPVTGFAVPSSAALTDGNLALMYSYDSGVGGQYGAGAQFVLLDSTGTPYYSQSVSDPGGFNFLTRLADGNVLLLYNGTGGASAAVVAVQEVTPTGATVPGSAASFNFAQPDGRTFSQWTASVGPAGFLVGQDRTIEVFNGSSFSAFTAPGPVVSAAQLANGQVLLLEVASAGGTVVYGQTFDPATGAFGAQHLIYSGLPGYSFPRILAAPDGGYVMDWRTGSSVTGLYVDASGQVGSPFSAIGTLHETLSGQIYATAVVNNQITVQNYTLQAGSTGTEALTLTIQPVTLPSAGWTSAAVLSNGALAVVDSQAGAYGSHQGAEQTYDANGKVTASAQLLGFAGAGQTLTPEVTALPVGGFYEVRYAGSTNFEVYNANDQQVFVHNQWTSPTAAFSPLATGGYVTTDSSSNVFGLFDANNANLGWISLPADAPSTPTVNALNGGGFVFTYAGTNHFDIYSASGGLLEGGTFSAAGSSFATGFAPLTGNGNGFVEAWLSPDGGQQGLPTSLDIQAMGPHGAITPVLTLTQDLDPWGTTFQLQPHADGSVAILWSQGGGVFGAEYANGVATSPFAAVAGDLGAMHATQLPNDQVGLAWFQNGDAWAEIFNPATGAVQRVDLGRSSSTDVSTLHALATAAGGLAVSWHQGSLVEGAVLDAAGQLGPLTGLPGDLLGVNVLGGAVTVHDNGAGTPILQTYGLNDGLFWVH